MAQTRKKKILEDVRKARLRRTLITTSIIAVLAVSVVVGIILLTPHSPSGSTLIGVPISSTVYSQLTGVSNTTLSQVGAGTATSLTTPIGSPVPPPLTSPDGRPEFLYVGGEFCPYCAAERWSIIVALSRFGSFSGLEYMLSADSPEAYPDTPTFTFVHATYSSNYIAFVSVEISDRNQKPLQTLTPDQQNLINAYDCVSGPPCGALAFVDIANQWVMGTQSHAGSQFLPDVLTGNWTQIGSKLNNPRIAVAQAVDGAANYLITAICKVDGGKPSGVCSQTFAKIQAPIGLNNVPPFNSFNTSVTSEISLDDLVWKSIPRPIW